jgi:tRNA (guanine6-N2)-methyltransferase
LQIYDIFALTTRGLETVSAREMAALPGMALQQTAYRRIAAQYKGSPAPLLRLRTVDDVYLSLGTWDAISHTRDMLAHFQAYATQLDVSRALKTIREIRRIPTSATFSVTASFVGKRNYSSDEIKAAVAEGITSSLGFGYTTDDRTANLNVRVFIDHEMAYVGLRLGQHPLHERDYKVVQRAGSLKPSVAAAMLYLAGLEPGHRLLDPCCGAGTILIEGAMMDAQARGGDIEAEAVEAARTNGKTAGVNITVEQWDARALPLANESTDRVVTNLPWGRQIVVDERLADFYRGACREMERVLALGGRVAILTSTPDLVRFEQLRETEAVEISLFGQKPQIMIFE